MLILTSITLLIPSRTNRGLAVIDWEEWRPLWDRNWGTKRIYQTLSVAHVMQANLSLPVQQATVKAKQQFQVRALCLRLNDKLYTIQSSEYLLIIHAIVPSLLASFLLGGCKESYVRDVGLGQSYETQLSLGLLLVPQLL